MSNDALMRVLSRTLNKPEEEVTGLLYEQGAKNEKGEPTLVLKEKADEIALAELAKWYNEKENSWKERNANERKDQYGRGKKETAEMYERLIGETTGYQSDLKGEEFIREALAHHSKSKKSDDFKTDPEFLKYEADLRKKYEAEKSEITKQMEEQKNSWIREKNFENAWNKAFTKMESMNPVYPKNPEAKTNLITVFKNHLKNFEYLDVNGQYQIHKDGSRLEHLGNPVDFDTFVENSVKMYFDIPAQNPKGAPAPGTPQGQNVKMCATEKEYRQAMATATTAEERIAIYEAHKGKF